MLVGGDGCDDARALDGLFDRLAGGNGQPASCKVLRAFCDGGGVDVVKADFADTADLGKGEGLEFGLRAVADQGHDFGLGGQPFCGHGAGGGGAQGGQDGHFRQQHRIAGRHIGQKAEGGDGLQPAFHVGGVAVHVFEAVGFAVGCGHQFDHADIGMAGDAGRLVEQGPAAEIGLDLLHQIAQDACDAKLEDKFHHLVDRHEGDEVQGHHLLRVTSIWSGGRRPFCPSGCRQGRPSVGRSCRGRQGKGSVRQGRER